MRSIAIKATGVASMALVLAACVSVPAGPSLQALPGSRKSFDQFSVDDGQCRGIASARVGGRSPSAAANESAAASAAAGTAIGAVTGAVIDGSAGAAAGAGIGLLVGAMAGTAASQDAYAITQQQFDGAYYHCMYGRGHKVPVPGNDVARYRARLDGTVPRAAAPAPPPSDFPPPDYRPPTALPPPPPPPAAPAPVR